MKRISGLLIILLSVFFLISCGEKIYIEVDENLQLKKGETKQLSVNTNDKIGLGFNSLDEAIVTVNDQGAVYGIKVGTATIVINSITDQKITSNVVVNVIEEENGGSEPVYTTYIKLEEGKEYEIGDIPYQNYDLLVEDDTIISVSDNTVLGIKKGSTNLTVTNKDNNESYIIEVEVVEQAPTILIEGEQNENGVYTTEVVITLDIDNPSKKIQYKIFETSIPNEWINYDKPIVIKKRGGYGLLYRTTDKYNTAITSEIYRENIVVDVVMDETYSKVIREGKEIKYKDGTSITLPMYQEKDNEIRGIWVSTVSNIDLSKYSSDEKYKEELLVILDTIKANNLNTVFFQVRSMNDAFYPSTLAPYSRYIKGIEGEGLDWDILEFVIEEAHKRGLELHAWLNPYRVTSGGTADSPRVKKEDQLRLLHDDNFAKQNPNLVLTDSYNNLILSPASSVVRDYLLDVISELLENYDIDGIHFDDYFYIATRDDLSEYSKVDYQISIEDWRRENVNLMIKGVNQLIKDYNQTNNDIVKFGVSPAGIWANSGTPGGSPTQGYAAYDAPLYADTRKWVLEEWIDYIIPQVYWDFQNSLAPYADIVKWWANLIDTNKVDVALIIGQGMYRFRDNNPWEDPNAIVEQIRYASKYDSVKGFTFFTFRDLLSSNSKITETLMRIEDSYWTKPAGWAWESKLPSPPTFAMLEIIDFVSTETERLDQLLKETKPTDDLIPEDFLEGEFFAPSSAINRLKDFLIDIKNIDLGNLTLEELQATKTLFVNEINLFEEEFFEGTYNPIYGKAKTSLQNAYGSAFEIRKIIYDSQGKPKEELDKDKRYVETKYITAIDNLLQEAAEALDNIHITVEEIQDLDQRLRAATEDIRNNFFYGTKED